MRTFCQDDAHIYCTPDQMQGEMLSFLAFLKSVYHTFGFDQMRVKLSTRPEKRLGSDEVWDHAEGALAAALKEAGVDYVVNAGDGAFYGPKIDFEVFDALKRPWQLGTLQVDYSMPARFGLIYPKPDGTEGHARDAAPGHPGQPGAVHGHPHRAHCAGPSPPGWRRCRWPSCPSPTAPMSSPAGRSGYQALAWGFRVQLDLRNEKVNAKIRDAQLQKVPVHAGGGRPGGGRRHRVRAPPPPGRPGGPVLWTGSSTAWRRRSGPGPSDLYLVFRGLVW